ncbi:Hypp1350 [Branchiostoma lanceolatum]|uniref:Hypp1350 protein n=1 Tax=Branchiostoma lanceolatum TaxID=7740 RepID=A0A8K0EN78_BRALA|nr:Hypp1350 [Branchiostoma lanceolatum]
MLICINGKTTCSPYPPNTCNDITTNGVIRAQENVEEEDGKYWQLSQTDKLNKSLLTSFLDRLNQQDAPFPPQTTEEDERVDTSGSEEQEFEDSTPSQDAPPLVRNTGTLQNGS